MYLVIRGDNLYKDMSSYLARRIEQTPNVQVLLNTEVRRMSGDGHLSDIELVNTKTGEVRTIKTPALFSFIGAVPRTDWLPPEIERDARGFVQTGPGLAASAIRSGCSSQSGLPRQSQFILPPAFRKRSRSSSVRSA